jgi:hypothetical protein
MSGAPDTPAERLEEYRRLVDGFLLGRDRSAAGIRFRFRGEAGVVAWVGDLAAREKACCAFFHVAVIAVGDEVRWDLSVIDDDNARLILADFYKLPETLAAGRTNAC